MSSVALSRLQDHSPQGFLQDPLAVVRWPDNGALFAVAIELCSLSPKYVRSGCCHASLAGFGLLPGRRIARAADAATAMMGGRLSWRFARYERIAADHASWAERRGLHAASRVWT